jgi:putative N6-adenine-specific DNA methylase
MPAAFLRRSFGFLRLPDFDAAVWNQVKTAANAGIREIADGLIRGSDISAQAVSAVRANRAALPHGGAIRVRRIGFEDLDGLRDTAIVTNPPHGIRLGTGESTAGLLKAFGDFLKQKCTGSSAFIYYGDASLVKKLGLKPDWKKAVSSGGLDGVFCRYELY